VPADDGYRTEAAKGRRDRRFQESEFETKPLTDDHPFPPTRYAEE
jgi:hypothetical protein